MRSLRVSKTHCSESVELPSWRNWTARKTSNLEAAGSTPAEGSKRTVDVIVACQPSKLDDREHNPGGAYEKNGNEQLKSQ